jgi:pimeloyl-ACP methyl ester carboxylesterase
VDFGNNDRPPLLLIAGGADHLTPTKVNRENAGRYRRSTAITAFHEFPGRSHFTIGQDGWEAVADYALDWSLDSTALRTSQSL